jgi:hypothetical protein
MAELRKVFDSHRANGNAMRSVGEDEFDRAVFDLLRTYIAAIGNALPTPRWIVRSRRS